jgi:predicted dehydrogenase
MKRIAFIDHNLENFHANVYLKLLNNELKSRGYSVTGCFGTRQKASREWAQKNNIPFFNTVQELNEIVDCYMILAPSNPETHLDLCQKIFPFGKPTYVDKTFAPDYVTAKRIFALADTYKVPMQTTSALRYTEVQDYVQTVGRKRVQHMMTWVAGGSFDEYAVHAIELLVSCMGPDIRRLMRRGTKNQVQLLLDLSGNRTGIVNVFPKTRTPYAASVTTRDETKYFAIDTSRIFLNTASAVINLFETGKTNIDRKESLIVQRIQDVARQKRAQNRWATL